MKKYSVALSVAVAVTALGLVSCISNAAGPMQAQLPTIQLQVGKHTVQAELANTNSSRQIGLMNRKELGENSGMLFVFKQSDTQCMWMKNTLIDLDVAFADTYGTILNIEQMKAGTADIHCSRGNAKLALEMNRDWFSKNGIKPGQRLYVPEQATTTQE